EEVAPREIFCHFPSSRRVTIDTVNQGLIRVIRKPDDIPSSEITPKSVYLNRRNFLAGAAAAAVAEAVFVRGAAPSAAAAAPAASKLPGFGKSSFSTDEKQTPLKDIANYNNYYEFSTDKYGPA